MTRITATRIQIQMGTFKGTPLGHVAVFSTTENSVRLSLTAHNV